MVIQDAENKDLKFRNPERLLLVVIGFILWSIGFLDLLGHTSAQPDVLGRYSWPFFVFIVLYGCTIVLWIALFVSPTLLSRLFDAVGALQRRNWLALGFMAGIGVALWVVLEWDRWSRLAGLQFAAFGLLLLIGGVLLFTGWRGREKGQWWRKVIAYPLFVLVGVELLVQLAAWFGVLPGEQRIGGDFVPYERIYANAEGFRNDVANRYGWTFPDFKLDDDKRRILIVGGADVQALSIPPEQQIAALLAEQIEQGRKESDAQTEVVAIGLPGFGPSPYLFEEFLSELRFDVDEIIVLFRLGDDFQHPSPDMNPILYTVDDAGVVDVHPSSMKVRHDLTHYFMRGLLSFQPVEVIRSHYLTPRLVTALIGGRSANAENLAMAASNSEIDFPRLRGYVTDNFALTEPGHAGIRATDWVRIPYGNNFIFEKNGSAEASAAMAIAGNILETAHRYAVDHTMVLRVVTVPLFPEELAGHFEGSSWTPEIDDYDLLLPERELAGLAAAAGYPLLPMGKWMATAGLDADAVSQLYHADGQRELSAIGQRYFSEAIYACFFAEAAAHKCPVDE